MQLYNPEIDYVSIFKGARYQTQDQIMAQRNELY
jgi:hypothetical protein